MRTLKAFILTSALFFSLLASLTAFAQPTRIPSFGPNGTHWPSYLPTPFPYDSKTFAHTFDVACSWTAIANQIKALTEVQVNAGVVIRVASGTLSGNGALSGSTPVLAALGSKAWTRRVTVVPADGFGAISVTTGARFYQLYGINITGFIFSDLNYSGSTNSAISWSLISGRGTFYGDRAVATTNFEITEVVFGVDAELNDNDRSNVATVGADIAYFRFEGCYWAPRQRLNGSTAHTDTLQFGYSIGGTYGNMEITDCAIFSSDNCCVQTGDIQGLIVTNSYLCGGPVERTRYPYLPGSYGTNAEHCFNGSGSKLEAHDSYFIGKETIGTSGAAQPWVSVTNTFITSEFSVSGTTAVQGGFTIDNSMSESNPIMPPLADESYRNKIWGLGKPSNVSVDVLIK